MGRAKTGAILVAAGLLLVGAAAVVPSFIDWSRHKDLVAERLQSMLGRPVTLDGPFSLSLLPSPRFTAEGAAIANLEGAADPSLFKVKRLELRLDLAALAGGRFEASSLVLVKPELSLETLPDGRVNWRIEKTARPSNEPSAAEPAAKAPAQNPSRVESLSIEDGVVTLRSPNRPTIRLDGIRATASADQTAYRGSGRVQLGGTAFAFDLMAGRGIGVETAPLSLALSLPGHRSDIKISGTVAPDWDGFAGKLAAASADLSDMAKTIGINPADLPKADARIDASLSASHKEIAAKDIHILLADQMADGKALLDLTANPRAEIDLSFKTLDADRLIALTGGHKPATATSAQTPSAPQPAPAPDAAPAQSAHPWRGIDADFHLSADLVTYKGSNIRRARFNGQVENGEILIDQASAELPGDADVTFFGFISLASGQPEFEGSFEAAATDLRGFLTWTGIDVGAAAQDRLRAMKITGDLRAAADRLALQGVKMTLDSSKAEGSLDLDLGPKPKAALTIEIDSVNADAYRPLFTRTDAPQDQPKIESKVPQTQPAQAGAPPRAPWFEALDATVKGRIGQLIAQGANAKDIVLNGHWDGHALALNGLSIADLEGAEIRAKGGISTGPTAFQGLEFAIRTQKPERLAALASASLPFPAERLGPTVLAGRIDGPLDNLTVNGRAEAAGAVLALSGTVAGLPKSPAIDAAVEASHSSLTQMIRLIRPDYKPRGSLGAFAATVKMTRSAEALTLSDLRFKLGPVTAAGDAKIGADNRFEIALTAGEIPLDVFLPATRKAELGPSSRTAAFATPRLNYTLAASGGMEHPPVSAAPRPKVEQGEITGHWSNDPLGLAILDGLAGTVKLDARALVWSGLRLDGAHVDFALGGGTAKVERLTGQLYGGQFEASGLLSSEGAASAKATLTHARMQDALPDLVGLDIADGNGDLSMEAETQGRSMAEMVGRLGGRAKLSVTDGRIKGFDLAAMNGKVASNGNVIGLIGGIQAGMNGGSTRFTSFGGTFHAVDGIITTDDLALAADGGGVKASGAINLPVYVMDAKADFRLAAANGNTPPLVLRVAGPIDHPRRFIDINAIQAWIARQGGAPADQDEGKTKKIKPKDVLKGLLEGLR